MQMSDDGDSQEVAAYEGGKKLFDSEFLLRREQKGITDRLDRNCEEKSRVKGDLNFEFQCCIVGAPYIVSQWHCDDQGSMRL